MYVMMPDRRKCPQVRGPDKGGSTVFVNVHVYVLYISSLILTYPEAVEMLRANGVEMGDEEDLRYVCSVEIT